MKYERVMEVVTKTYEDEILKRQDILENGDMDSDEYMEAYQILCDKDKVAELLLIQTDVRLSKHIIQGEIITPENEYDKMDAIARLVSQMPEY